MPDLRINPDERKAIEAEQIKAYLEDANDLNIAGLVVFSLLIYVVHDLTPPGVWSATLSVLVLITLIRVYLIRQYRSIPESRSTRFWMNSQAIGGGLAGVCWGLTVTGMLMHLPVTYQFFVLTVAVVVAATATSEGFTLVNPPRFFTVASLTPPAIWSVSVADRLHAVIALMLLLFIVLTSVVARKKNRIFIEAQHLRFKNERLVKELSLKQELLEAANKSKSRFLAAASHDLRQPLAALMIFLEQLEFERQLSTSGKDVLEHAQQATGSLCSLLDSLLDISRLDGHSIRVNVKAFPMRNLFDELAEEFRPLAEQKGIPLKFSPCSAVVESDVILLMQILRNLISNALRYTPSGRVLVGGRRRRGMLDIEVHDTGIGIPEDQRPRIFEEFYQVNNPERDRQRGLGLGLSIVDRAAGLLGHRVSLTSVPGKGTTFIVSVPLAEAAIIDVPIDRHSRSAAHDFENNLIGIIENEGAIRTGLQNLLQSWGSRVVIADSAASMLRQLETMSETIDMIVSDFGLGGSLNGVEAIAEIRQRWGADLPALLFTGNISKETYHLAKEAGLSILYKPARADELRDAIAATLGRGRLNDDRA